jgi:hypothetical protein
MLISIRSYLTRGGLHTVVCEDEALVLETLVDVAIALKVGRWGAELRGVWVRAGEAAWQGAAAGEEPGPDGVAVPFHDVVSTLLLVEGGAEGVCADFVHVAACRTSGVKGTVSAECGVTLAGTVDFTSGVGVQDILIHSIVVHTLNDVDLNYCQLVVSI